MRTQCVSGVIFNTIESQHGESDALPWMLLHENTGQTAGARLRKVHTPFARQFAGRGYSGICGRNEGNCLPRHPCDRSISTRLPYVLQSGV